MLKIEDVKVGDELVCINNNNEYMVVGNIPASKCFLIEKGVISYESLKYFKKKEQSQYTFNDLIDVAVQAWKDDVLSGLSLDNVGVRKLSYWGKGFDDHVFEQYDDYIESVNSIKSLYKETFVIESEKDVERLNNGAKTTLKNGEVIYFQNIDDGDFWFTFNDYGCEKFPFLALKGATVEQERGRDD